MNEEGMAAERNSDGVIISAAERRNVYSTPRTKRLAAPEGRNVFVSGAHEWAYKHQKPSVAIDISCLRH